LPRKKAQPIRLGSGTDQDALENPFDGIGVDDVNLDDDAELYWLPEDEAASPMGD